MGHGLVVDHWIVIVVAILWVVVKGLNQSSINQGIGKSALDYHYHPQKCVNHTNLIQNHITVLPHQKLNFVEDCFIDYQF